MTYIRTAEHWLYLAVAMDLYSKKVVGWSMSACQDRQLVLQAVWMAIWQRKGQSPVILHSDRGTQFTSAEFTGVLKQHGIRISMDSKGRWVDNGFVERLWRSVKYEEVYLKAYDSIGHARASLSRYFAFYNTKRRHQSLDRRTPDSVYYQDAARMAA